MPALHVHSAFSKTGLFTVAICKLPLKSQEPNLSPIWLSCETAILYLFSPDFAAFIFLNYDGAVIQF
jgi:hypothetical protein